MSSEITINSNIASLQTQRRLGQNTSALTRVFERLSSGQRINRASDDAAGLAISESLRADQRVLSQGVRNLNDGVSLLNIGEGALSELTNIVTRIQELAEQSANGTLGATQRRSLDAEAQALSAEYFRIARTTTFNGLNLFDGSVQGLSLQDGYGAAGALQTSMGGKLGTGTFQTSLSVGTSNLPGYDAIADLNGDGFLDIAATSQSNVISVLLGNGDGTFKAKADYGTAAGLDHIALGDVNGDGALDLVSANNTGNNVSVLIGNGDGSFKAKSDYGTVNAAIGVTLGDVNGDGALDLVAQSSSGPFTAVMLGNGDGSFRAQTNFTSSTIPFSVALADLNADGLLDIVSTGGGGGSSAASVLLGNGNGTFKAKFDYATGNSPRGVAIKDFNSDGVLDIVSANWLGSSVSVLLGNGNGSFKATADYTTGSTTSDVSVGDIDGDGVLDLVSANWGSSTVSLLLGNGDGTFKAKSDLASGSFTTGVDLGDFNGDGVLDLASTNAGINNIAVFLAATRDGVSPLLEFSLKTRSDALQAMPELDRSLKRISAHRGFLGAFQSRVGSAINNTQITIENFAAAESQIRDSDVALEAANLTRGRILQQAAAAVLAQANQEPQIALKLLQAG